MVTAASILSPESSVRFRIGGMTCAACAGRLESALGHTPGVTSASVNLALESAEVRFDPAVTSRERLFNVVGETGFTAEDVTPRHDGAMLTLSAALTAPLVAAMAAHTLGLGFHLPPWLEFALATPVQFICGARFYRGAFAALKHGTATMDVLIALGTTAAYALSAVRATTIGGDLYFESSAVIITLVLLGKSLEARAKRSAVAALKALMDLKPSVARVRRADADVETPISEVAIGDVVVIKPGEKIPVDGTIIEGLTECDESLITGESAAVTRAPGDAVTGGAINGSGLIVVRTTAIGGDSTLAKIARIVEQAQHGKAPIQKLVDRVSAIFVPVVIVAAFAVFAGWLMTTANFDDAVSAAISVLVIACPCALGLATPAALVAGTGAAARAGILIKNIDALERARSISTVVLDKTGTLTQGRPEITDVALGNGAPHDTIELFAAAEGASEHVYARAATAYAKTRALRLPLVTSLTAVPGRGIVAEVAGRKVAAGNDKLFAEMKLALDPAMTLPPATATRIHVAIDGRHAASVAVADPVRAESKAAVDQLIALGVAPRILSGDHPETVAAIARVLGIADAAGGLSPKDKADVVAALRQQGAHVAMVGDGINDAPALAAADVGIAIGGGADAAMETADITLLRPDPRLIAAAFDVSRATWRKIQQNLFWAMIYNLIAVPFAAAGALTPALAAAAMAASSVSVIVNALGLRSWRAPE